MAAPTGSGVPHKDYPFDENDPNTFWGAYARDVWNNGESGAIPGWYESRYFTEPESWEAYLQTKGSKTTPEALTTWFEDSAGFLATGDGAAWSGMNDEEHELQIYRAGQRIQHTYMGAPDGVDGNAAHYPTCSGKERYEAEKRLGVEHGSLY